MNNLPKISFITLTYDAGNLFNELLNSINKQDYPKNLFEILIIDGGSTDNTLKIAKKHDVKIKNNKNYTKAIMPILLHIFALEVLLRK